MISRLPRRLLWVLLIALSIAAAWLLGKGQADQQAQRQLQEMRVELETLQLQGQVMLDQHQQELEQLQRAREVADARAAALQGMLDDRLKQSADDVAELALYRRIAGEDAPRGLWLDSVAVSEMDPRVLEITLVQSRGRDRATGIITVSLIDADGQVQELAPEPFDLRFFKTLLVQADSITTIEPASVEIAIQPENVRLKPSVQRFQWQEVRR